MFPKRNGKRETGKGQKAAITFNPRNGVGLNEL
jgi:hypothetical protein